MAAPQAGMKKRQIIANSNRTMFFWVAGMSAIIGICAVLALFLAQQLAFKTKVTIELDKTLATINQNNKVSTALLDNIRARSTDSGLNAVKAQPEDQALQVILDALPADQNTLALGSSLQQKLLTGVNGIKIESMNVEQATSVDPSQASTPTSETVPQMKFSFSVSSNDPNSLKDLLVRLEKSIRVIDIDNIILNSGSSSYTMNVVAHAYYQPAVQIELGTKQCTPEKGC
ncbi:MAG: hypothetical protein KA604_01875 [Candidatus Saccharimonas sp.]|nr:hypothetical protein [Candidatus Saccharimonas sp.]